MTRQRLVIWSGLLLLVLGIRWWDPMGQPKTAEQAESAPIERAEQSKLPATTPLQIDTTASMVPANTWPARKLVQDDKPGNAFLARSQVPPPQVKQAPSPPPTPMVYAPPPPPQPVEIQPPLQVIGTWGDEANLAVFLSGPQGTVLARAGDVILSDYKVQSVSKNTLTLQQNSNQRSWNLAIPSAPSALQTWPGR